MLKLSDAVVLGDSLRRREPTVYLAKEQGGHCGCAIGGAVLAMGGRNGEDMYRLFPWLLERPVKQSWKSHAHIIGVKFCDVTDGLMTFEALVAYIKSVEPACGRCNSFRCTCVKAAAVEESVLVAHV